MGQALDQARFERELTKEALESDLDRLERRVRAELDWKSRLRRDGPRLAMVGGAGVALIAAVVALRIVLGRRSTKHSPVSHLKAASLDDIALHLRELRDRFDGKSNGKSNGKSKGLPRDEGPLWQKVLLRGSAAAGAAGGTFVARRYLERETASARDAAAAAGVASERAAASG